MKHLEIKQYIIWNLSQNNTGGRKVKCGYHNFSNGLFIIDDHWE